MTFFQERETDRDNAIKTEEKHKCALSELHKQFYEDIKDAYDMAGVETSKQLANEQHRILADQAVAVQLQKERHIFRKASEGS